MNVDFSPKKQFQSNDTLRQELQTVVISDNFQQSLSFALSEFVTRFNPSGEQISGVRNFINTLIHLPIEQQPMPVFPQKTLDYAAYEADRTKTKTT